MQQGMDIGARLEELAQRTGDGIEVTLLWSRADGRLTVVCEDARSEELLVLPATPENALDVFYHPFAYAAREGIEYGVRAAPETLAA
jgi:hypothetical protein